MVPQEHSTPKLSNSTNQHCTSQTLWTCIRSSLHQCTVAVNLNVSRFQAFQFETEFEAPYRSALPSPERPLRMDIRFMSQVFLSGFISPSFIPSRRLASAVMASAPLAPILSMYAISWSSQSSFVLASHFLASFSLTKVSKAS